MPRRWLIAEPGVEVHRVALRNRVDERDQPAEGEAADGGDDLLRGGIVRAKIDDRPADENYAQQEEQIPAPLDRLADRVAHLLIAAEDAAPRRLAENTACQGHGQ